MLSRCTSGNSIARVRLKMAILLICEQQRFKRLKLQLAMKDAILQGTLQTLHKQEVAGDLLHQITEAFAANKDMEQLCICITETTRHIVDAERVSIFFYDSSLRELSSVGASGSEDGFRMSIDGEKNGIAANAVLQMETIFLADAYQYEHFNPLFDAETGFRTRSVMAIPMLGMNKDCMGVLQCINKSSLDSTDTSPVFGPRDKSHAEEVATLASLAIERMRNVEKAEQEVEKHLEEFKRQSAGDHKRSFRGSLTGKLHSVMESAKLTRGIHASQQNLYNSQKHLLHNTGGANQQRLSPSQRHMASTSIRIRPGSTSLARAPSTKRAAKPAARKSMVAEKAAAMMGGTDVEPLAESNSMMSTRYRPAGFESMINRDNSSKPAFEPILEE